MTHFPYKWKFTDGYPAAGIKPNACKVFGTFICGGGSTMGYKLAGFDHLGGVEIDQQVAEIYRLNHSPRFLFVEDIRKFNQRTDLPPELFNLDLLDGSPPCSSFSMAGNREKDWGVKKEFREGQAKQRLDDLVFEYIDTIEKLQPKVALLENVKGLILGNAKAYAKALKERFEEAGYKVQVFLLNAATMGLPQARVRVFFIGLRKDLNLPPLKLQFNHRPIPFKEVMTQTDEFDQFIEHSELFQKYWEKAKLGEVVGTFQAGSKRLHPDKVCNTVAAQGGYNHFHPYKPRQMSLQEVSMVGSFPLDYNFNGMRWHYLIGMSVPPVMTAQIAYQIYIQWLSKVSPKAALKAAAK